MPRTALALNLLFLLIAVGGRTWIQYRRSGDFGFRIPSRSAGPLEKLAGALLLAGVAGLLGSAGWAAFGLASPLAAFDRSAAHVLGVLFMGAGIALTVAAELQMGDSWRIGVDPAEETSLVEHGLFDHVRNPIYTGMLLGALGLFCLVPTRGAALAGLLLLAGVELQVRGVEEPYLVRRHGPSYVDYARSVGRFLPRLGRLG